MAKIKVSLEVDDPELIERIVAAFERLATLADYDDTLEGEEDEQD